MKIKSSPLILLLVAAILSLFTEATSAQTADAKIAELNINADPNSGPGGTYIATDPTASSGSRFSANLTWFADDNQTVSMVSASNRNFDGGSLSSFSFTHAGSYEGGGGNAFTFYLQYYRGGSPVVVSNNYNDVYAVNVGAGIARPLDDKGSWSWGFNASMIASQTLPSLVIYENQYNYTYYTYLSAGLSISYNGKDPSKASYFNYGAEISNLGIGLSSEDQSHSKSFLPTDAGIGAMFVQIFPDQNVLTVPVDIHISLAPAMPYTEAQVDAYQKIGYGVFSPSKIVSASMGIEYKIIFNKMGDADNYLSLQGGAKVDGPNFDKRYTGLQPGLGLKVDHFILSGSYFWTPGINYGLYSNTFLLGLVYDIPLPKP